MCVLKKDKAMNEIKTSCAFKEFTACLAGTLHLYFNTAFLPFKTDWRTL